MDWSRHVHPQLPEKLCKHVIFRCQHCMKIQSSEHRSPATDGPFPFDPRIGWSDLVTAKLTDRSPRWWINLTWQFPLILTRSRKNCAIGNTHFLYALSVQLTKGMREHSFLSNFFGYIVKQNKKTNKQNFRTPLHTIWHCLLHKFHSRPLTMCMKFT